MTIDELKREAMRLEPTERRRQSVVSGEATLVPMDEVFAQAKANRAS